MYVLFQNICTYQMWTSLPWLRCYREQSLRSRLGLGWFLWNVIPGCSSESESREAEKADIPMGTCYEALLLSCCIGKESCIWQGPLRGEKKRKEMKRKWKEKEREKKKKERKARNLIEHAENCCCSVLKVEIDTHFTSFYISPTSKEKVCP